MPFDLTNTPANFQANVNKVLRDLIIKKVFMFLDHIHIFFLADHQLAI